MRPDGPWRSPSRPARPTTLSGAGALLKKVPAPKRLIADRAYDARKLRDWLTERGCEPVIPPNPTRKNPHSFDAAAYKLRNRIERMFCRLKDFRRIATRYDKRADTFLSAAFIAATLAWSTNRGLTLVCISCPSFPRLTALLAPSLLFSSAHRSAHSRPERLHPVA